MRTRLVYSRRVQTERGEDGGRLLLSGVRAVEELASDGPVARPLDLAGAAADVQSRK